MMTGSKKWYKSKGVWGGIVTLLTIALGWFGYYLTPEQIELTVLAFMSIASGISTLVGLWGRLKAKEEIR